MFDALVTLACFVPLILSILAFVSVMVGWYGTGGDFHYQWAILFMMTAGIAGIFFSTTMGVLTWIF